MCNPFAKLLLVSSQKHLQMVGAVFIRQQQPLHLQDLLMQQPRHWLHE